MIIDHEQLGQFKTLEMKINTPVPEEDCQAFECRNCSDGVYCNEHAFGRRDQLNAKLQKNKELQVDFNMVDMGKGKKHVR